MTSKNPEQKGQKGGKEELVSIDSLDQLKRELKSENLDTSKDEYFKEKQIKIKIAKSELNKLSEEIKGAGEDQEKILNLLKQFITSKEQTKENSRHGIDTLKSQIESNLNAFGLDGIKKSLDTIESIEENNTVERGFLTNCLLGIIEANGYNFHLENNNIKLDSKGDLAPEIEILINNYINKNKFNAENIKTAILYRTTKFQDFVKSNTNTKGELMVEGNDAKKYYEFLLEKYELKSIFGASDNDIKNNTKIDKKDKAFLLSYKNNAFENYNLDNKMKQYVSDKNELFQRLKDISTKNDKNPDVNMDSHKVITEKISSMNPNQVAGKLLNNPIGLIGEVLSGSGALAPFVLIAMIWGLFQYPKQILGGLAALGLGKAFGITDSLAKGMTNANGSSEGIKLPDVGAKAKEIMKKFTPNTTFKQKTREHVAVKGIDQTKFDELHDSLEHCEEFRNKNIEELEKAFHNKESQNLGMFFNSIKKINGQTGQEFYENNKDNLGKLVSVMLLNKKKGQKTVGELYDNVPEKELEKQPKSGNSEKADKKEDKEDIKHEEIGKLKQRLLQKLNDFREIAKNANSWHDFLSRSKEDIQKDNQKLINARKEVETVIGLIQIHPEGKSEMAGVNSAFLELAKYYAGSLDITNDQYRDYSQSIAYSYSILNGDGVARIKSQPPTEDDVLKKLAGKEVGNLIVKHLRDGKQLGEILSNPKIKGAWGEVYSKCFDSYEKDLSKELKALNKEHKSGNTILTNEQQGALKLLSSIQGEDGRIDFKKRTCDNIWLATKSIGAVGAGIGLYAISPFSGGTTALVGNIALASGLTTLGMMAAGGRRYDLQEGAVEFGINAGTFVVGGIIFKASKIIQGTSKLASLRGVTAVGTEAIGDIAIGAMSDKTRAWYNDIGLTYTDAFVDNLAWGLMPLGIRGLSSIKSNGIRIPYISKAREHLAGQVLEAQNRAYKLTILGDKKAAKEVIEKMEKKITDLRAREGGLSERKQKAVGKIDEKLESIKRGDQADYNQQIKTMRKILPGLSKDIKNLKRGEKIKVEHMEVEYTKKDGYLVKNTETGNVKSFKNYKEAMVETFSNLNGEQMLKYRLSQLGDKIDLKKIDGQRVKIKETEYLIKTEEGGKISFYDKEGKLVTKEGQEHIMNELDKMAIQEINKQSTYIFKRLEKSEVKLSNLNMDLSGLSNKLKVPVTKLRDWTVGDLWKKIGAIKASNGSLESWKNLFKPSKWQLICLTGFTAYELTTKQFSWIELGKNYAEFTLLNPLGALGLEFGPELISAALK